MSAEDLNGFVVHYKEEDEITVNAKHAEAGDYAFNLFAKDSGTDKSCPNVCCHLVSAGLPARDTKPFLEIANGALCATKALRLLEVEPLSHR